MEDLVRRQQRHEGRLGLEVDNHPGSYIRRRVIPAGTNVTQAAMDLEVSRSTLSRLLNEKTALSRRMAAKLHRTFGADGKKLLKMQEAFDLHQCMKGKPLPKILPRHIRRVLSGPGLKTFFRIAGLWGLSADEQMKLLGVDHSTFNGWKRTLDEPLSTDALTRISYILGIYEALHVLLPDERAADGWVRRPNTASPFNGESALERMLSGRVEDLSVVRRYLDAQKGGWA